MLTCAVGGVTQQISLLVDATPPTIACPSTPTFAQGSVAAPITATIADEGSGIASEVNAVLPNLAVLGTGLSVDISAIDVAGNARTVACTYNVVDQTPPTITCPAAPPTFYQGSAAAPITVTATDDGSGLSVAPAPFEPNVAVVGSLTAEFTAADVAGNIATVQCPYDVIPDPTLPVIEHSVTGTMGTNGWYVGDVTVTFTENDPESVITTPACEPVTISSDTAKTDVTCTATSAGGTSTDTVPIYRDATPPTLTCPSPIPSVVQGNPLTVTAAVQDATSGPVSATVSATVDSTVLGAGQHVTLVGTDEAGNTASASCTYDITADPSLPVITPTVVGDASAGGPGALANATGDPRPTTWYRSDVQISFTVADPDSPILSTAGCDPSSITQDTTGTTLTCTVTSYGGTATQSLTIARDATPPTISCPATPTIVQGNEGSLTAAFSDATSGPTAPTGTTGADTSTIGNFMASFTARDEAGNTTVEGCPYVVIPDTTVPSIVPVITGQLGADGWYIGDVTVRFDVSDPDSPIISTTGCGPQQITADTMGTTITCTAKSYGGPAAKSVLIKRDTVSPKVTCLKVDFIKGAADTQTLGWASDATSGVSSSAVQTKIDSSAEGWRTATLSVSDEAGNTTVKDCPYQVYSPAQVKAAQLTNTGHNLSPLIIAGILIVVCLGIGMTARLDRRGRQRNTGGSGDGGAGP